MAPVTVRVPAKVNLQLSVGPERPDGYHELVTVFHAVSLFDEVTAAPSDELRITVEGEGAAEVPLDDGNLAMRAARLLAAEVGIDPRAHLHIRKGIPVAGGMAGGSADAAAALVACDELWHAGLPVERLHLLAAELGSDVPFALIGGTAIGTGRGERLTPALARGRYHWVFALADKGLSTPAVYRECDRLRAGQASPPVVSEALMTALRSGDPSALGRALCNDLQPAALSLRPHLRLVLEAGEEAGALGGIVSGSGPTCAFLARDEAHALDIAVALSSSGVCRTVRCAHGPVPGARMVRR
ncbi:4-(cytidine 5'-diphospho)-2-C-methyl-D-erythritol kinase [Carbonactinospora thermoautotrophica]|uniref:4-(cytidine 5'-diphospho)-2-C-methyl-D-erythritol kinase n=1 Tax=Carbonactinospora thermoautotrophica TaxID=1469144 RepID=UPI00226D953C|nr:4-(cytidine 5'-diphospho)-2-C-methyl-D-erythritol kinase [Carbonactinospora thermoautotrophica]MCX9191702.1 4-(cytidine 5'-diphospho)-2-C-methyl-D-erythritol kinase [Carbonactinospora thermoautotrophica]